MMAYVHTEYVVMAATDDDMERYGVYDTLERAKSVADDIRTWNPGTIRVLKEIIVTEEVYTPKGRTYAY